MPMQSVVARWVLTALLAGVSKYAMAQTTVRRRRCSAGGRNSSRPENGEAVS
jgi:hypothetical protein